VFHSTLFYLLNRIGSICNVRRKPRMSSALVLHPPKMRHSITVLRSTRGPLFKRWLDLPSLCPVTSSFNSYNGKLWSKGKGSPVRYSRVRCLTLPLVLQFDHLQPSQGMGLASRRWGPR
jgi:hypothetical protein